MGEIPMWVLCGQTLISNKKFFEAKIDFLLLFHNKRSRHCAFSFSALSCLLISVSCCRVAWQLAHSSRLREFHTIHTQNQPLKHLFYIYFCFSLHSQKIAAERYSQRRFCSQWTWFGRSENLWIWLWLHVSALNDNSCWNCKQFA